LFRQAKNLTKPKRPRGARGFVADCAPLCGWRSMWLCHRYARPAATRSATASACARPAGQNYRSLRNRTAPNVQDAFRAPSDQKARIVGKRLVLIDDVLTSGATVDTCARAPLRAGAAHVDVLVFARVVAPLRTPI